MESRITIITLGVDDLEKSVAFYRALGFTTEGIVGKEYEYGAVAFFELQNNLKLALWPRTSLAHDAGISPTPASSTDMALAHNVGSEKEVDEVMEQAEKAGAMITKPVGKTFYGGYAGYFQDPDKHLWEIAWNPAWQTEE